MTVVEMLEIGAMVLMLVGVLAIVFIRRLIERDGMRRAIQFLSVTFVVPTILILALQGILKAETIGTLIGALIGYLLSGIGTETPRSKTSSGTTADDAAQPAAGVQTPPAPRP